LAVLAAAVVGGIVRPIAARGALPFDSDFDVDTEHACDDGSGELGGELEKGGRTG
jgi:hypothetical protein